MSLDALKSVEIIEALEQYLERSRPPEHIRKDLDIGYKIDNQSIEIFEIRPSWKNPKETKETPVAKTTFVSSKNHWKVFWMRADLKWHGYTPKLEVKTLAEFLKLVEEDKHGCFWG